MANMDEKVCAILHGLEPAIECLTQQHVWLASQNKELWTKMANVIFWRDQAENEKKESEKLISKCTETMFACTK